MSFRLARTVFILFRRAAQKIYSASQLRTQGPPDGHLTEKISASKRLKILFATNLCFLEARRFCTPTNHQTRICSPTFAAIESRFGKT
jgi:hypothetical protein